MSRNICREAAVCLIASLIALTAPGAVLGQLSSGTILGVISDSSGAVIPGVSIRVTNPSIGLVRETITNESGNYRIEQLPPGEYRVEAELSGFRKEIHSGVRLSIDQRARIDFTLVVGEVTEVIDVVGEAPLVQTDDSSVGQVVEARKIVNLPLNGRNFSSLAYIVPGAFAPRPNSGLGYRGGFSIAGMGESTNQFLLDGINNNGTGTMEIGARVNIDAVGEFKVQTGNYSAQYGRFAGAQVDVITKSGTNEFRGSAFFFHRNDNLDARNFFDPWPVEKLPEFRRHQYGGVIGGPVVRNKLFFFAGYQGQRQIKFRTLSPTVPVPEFFGGNLSRISTPIRDPRTGQPFLGNIIPRDRLSPIALGFQRFWPAPDRPGLVQNATTFLSSPDNYNQTNGRIDYQLSPRQRLTGAFTHYSNHLMEWEIGGRPEVPGFQVSSEIISSNLSLSHVTTLSPSMINEFRTGFSRLRRGRFQEDRSKNWNQTLGIFGTMADTDPIAWGVPVIDISGYARLGDGTNIPQPRVDMSFSWIDTLSVQFGNHALKMGVDAFRQQMNLAFVNAGRGAFTFTGARTGHPMGDFLLGLPAVSQRAPTLGPISTHPRRSSVNAFLQDDLKMTRNLTLNFGVRWEGNFNITERYGRLSAFDPTLGNGQGGIRILKNSERYANAVATFRNLYPGLVIEPTDALHKKDMNNFAPRFGFAYSMFGSTDTVMRGGYGVFYQISTLCFCSYYTNTPFNRSERFTTADGITLDNPWGAARGATISQPGIDPNLVTPYYQHWNLGIQREMPGGFVVDVTYQGKKGTKLFRSRDINQPLNRATGVRPYRFFSLASYEESSGNSIYHGLHIRSERRSSQGLSYLLSYMWGRMIDDTGTPQDSYNQAAERGLSSEDARHRFTFSYVYELPFGHDRPFLADAPGLVNNVLGGWELSGILRANTGYPQTATISVNNSGTGNLRDRPHQMGNPNRGSSATPRGWYDPNAFIMPASGQFGNAGRGTLTGPGYWALDFSTMKRFRVGETHQIELRFEAFNALNHPSFDDPVTTWNSAAFGSVRGALLPRELQLGLKWNF